MTFYDEETRFNYAVELSLLTLGYLLPEQMPTWALKFLKACTPDRLASATFAYALSLVHHEYDGWDEENGDELIDLCVTDIRLTACHELRRRELDSSIPPRGSWIQKK